jgi:hypothetical protein
METQNMENIKGRIKKQCGKEPERDAETENQGALSAYSFPEVVHLGLPR